MRIPFFLLWLLLAVPALAQPGQFNQLLAAGKAEFKKEDARQDYRAAVSALEAAVRLKPTHVEAHYFLGYAYNRLSTKDGETLLETSRGLTLKASREFETVNRLTPRYQGELVALDPYAKLTSIWSSLALRYRARNQADSVRWAFNEGKKRGGFGELFLANARAMLDQCQPNGILMSSGDSYTFPLWYVQLQEGYRPDVAVIDVGLLASKWYPAQLETSGLVQFGLLPAVRDTTNYFDWTPQAVSVLNAGTHLPFTWTVLPHPFAGDDSTYLKRNDMLLLSLLKANEFRRAFYFTNSFSGPDQLDMRLNQELIQRLIVQQVNAAYEPEPPVEQFVAGMRTLLPIVAKVNFNSVGEINLVNMLRYEVISRLGRSVNLGLKAEYKPLIALIDQYFPLARFPFNAPDQQQLYEYARANW